MHCYDNNPQHKKFDPVKQTDPAKKKKNANANLL